MAALIVFGDSLCDSGNAYALRGQEAVPCPPHWRGRRCNGPIWVEQLAARQGLPAPLPSQAGGSNHACGGARSGPGFSPKGMPNLLEQVEAFAAGRATGGATTTARPAFDPASALVVLRAGANDYLDTPPSPTVAEAVNRHLLAALDRLMELGLRRFLVPSELPWGFSPIQLPGYDSAARRALNGLITQQNSTLAEALATRQGVWVGQPDFHHLLEAVRAQPARFGFREVEAAVLPPEGGAVGAPAPSGEGFLWWDSWGHLTTAFHALLAAEASAVVNNAA
jgi:phospholipase/lecithinase/hemolysin